MMDEMRVVGRVVGLFRYPVKSMLGETLTVVDARSSGFVGDRAFGLIDVWSSRLLSAKTVPALLLASAMFADGEVTMTLPTGIVSSADPNVDDTLSTWLDRDVRLARPTEGVASTIDIEVDLTERGGPEAHVVQRCRCRFQRCATAATDVSHVAITGRTELAKTPNVQKAFERFSGSLQDAHAK